jgi:hypothetical protein
MIALFNFIPNHCPNCGQNLVPNFTDPLSRQDFLQGASCTCPGCQLSHAFVPSDKLLAATIGNGDLTHYVKLEDEPS